MITLSFEEQSLHDACIELREAEVQFGSLTADALVTFISDALASENAEELCTLYGDQVKFSGDDSLSVVIGSDYEAALVVAGKRFKRDGDGRVIWSSVMRLKLVEMSRVP